MDQFQGRDKDVIVYSCTRTTVATSGNKSERSGDILHDLRRLNVALTRARRKAVLVGSRESLAAKYEGTFGRLFGVLDEEDFVQLNENW